MDEIVYRVYHAGDEFAIHNLIKKVYDEFVAIDYSEEGNRFFYDWIDPVKISERQNNDRSILIALKDNEIVGVIEIRNKDRISLLFVEKSCQGKGIAKRLFAESLKLCLVANPDLKKFYVHASPFSIPIYKKLGFKEIDVIQENHGIKYLPMEMEIG